MNNLKAYKKAMEKKEILKGMVKMVQPSEEYKSDILVLDLDGVVGIVLREDVDLDLEHKSLVGFLGREINFVIKSIDTNKNTLFCSRKEAQAIQKEEIVGKLQEGEVFNGQIVNILKYGAYVEIQGVTGLLKNVDFAEDYTTIGEVLKVGSNINVKLKKISANNKLIFQAVEKYKNPTIMNISAFEADQVVLGVVRNVKPWGIYVCIAPGLDALCPIPGTGEIEEGMKVCFRITQVKSEEGRVRGKIVRTL